jgi:hypothetical protein
LLHADIDVHDRLLCMTRFVPPSTVEVSCG